MQKLSWDSDDPDVSPITIFQNFYDTNLEADNVGAASGGGDALVGAASGGGSAVAL
jgi:hypothetical protein